MKSLFEKTNVDEIIERINKLTPETKAQWGKMRVEQMLAHMQPPILIALGEQKMKGGLMAFLFGKIGKKAMVKEVPFKKNLPTAPAFVVKTEKNFNEEKDKLIALLKKYSNTSPEEIAKRPHPFFGKLTADEWNTLQYKHFDHHLAQFGV